MISWYSWFFDRKSILAILVIVLFQMRFRGDGFSIHIYDALICGVKYCLQSAALNLNFFCWFLASGHGKSPWASHTPGLFHLEQDLKKRFLGFLSHTISNFEYPCYVFFMADIEQLIYFAQIFWKFSFLLKKWGTLFNA